MSSKSKYLASFSDDLLLLIFWYLNAKEIYRIEKVCSNWRKISRNHDTEIWKLLTEVEWKRIEFNIPQDVNVLRKIEKMSLSSLKKSLVGIDLSRCLEKKDFQRMVLAKVLFSSVMKKELGGDDPRFKGKYLSMFYPEWSLSISPFKASYIFTKHEVKRIQITKYELCNIQWTFRFKRTSFDDPDHAQLNGSWQCRFYEDFTMHSTLQGHTYQWRVTILYS